MCAMCRLYSLFAIHCLKKVVEEEAAVKKKKPPVLLVSANWQCAIWVNTTHVEFSTPQQ